MRTGWRSGASGVGGATGSCIVAENVNGGIGEDTKKFARGRT